MPPYALDDDALSQLRAAAAPLPADCRAEFIQAVTAALAGVEPGPGVLYRTIAPLQRLYLSATGLEIRTAVGRGAEGTGAEPALSRPETPSQPRPIPPHRRRAETGGRSGRLSS